MSTRLRQTGGGNDLETLTKVKTMYPRKNYEMTAADLEKILDASKPVPMIMLHLGTPRSQQERANDAWQELGERMGFDSMTVEPAPGGDRFFTAVPSETPEQQAEREAREKEALKQQEILCLKEVIKVREERLAELQDESVDGPTAAQANEILGKQHY